MPARTGGRVRRLLGYSWVKECFGWGTCGLTPLLASGLRCSTTTPGPVKRPRLRTQAGLHDEEHRTVTAGWVSPVLLMPACDMAELRARPRIVKSVSGSSKP